MRFNKNSVYFGTINKADHFEVSERVVVKGKPEYNGEKEVFVKINNYFVPIREIKNFIQILIIKHITKNNLQNKKFPAKFKKLLLPSDKFKIEELCEIFTINDYRYVTDIELVFADADGTISLTKMQDLRLRHKYLINHTGEEKVNLQ